MNEDELLSRELAKLGGVGGAFGGAVSGGAAGGVGGERGGSAGAAVASKFLPSEYHQTEIELGVEPQALLKSAYSFFEANGEVLGEGDDSESRYPKLSGVVGSGFFNMNPTVLHVEIVAAEEGKCSVLLTGHAKEGLIKQRSAEKAVGRMADFLPAAAQ